MEPNTLPDGDETKGCIYNESSVSGTLSRYIVKIVNLKENKRNFKTSIR